MNLDNVYVKFDFNRRTYAYKIKQMLDVKEGNIKSFAIIEKKIKCLFLDKALLISFVNSLIKFRCQGSLSFYDIIFLKL